MKKTIFLIASVFIMLVSCAKIDVVHEIYTPTLGQEICFSSGMGKTTKAIVEGNIYSEDFTFWVLGHGGYYTTSPYIADSVKYDATYQTWRTINRTYLWKFENSDVKSDTMDFFAIHPAEISYVSSAAYSFDSDIKTTGDQYATITGATPGTVVGSQTDLMTSFVDNITATRTNTAHENYVNVDNSSRDSLHTNSNGANTPGTATDKTVNFRFHHEYAQIKFQARTSAKSTFTITVKKLEFVVPCIKGTVVTKGYPTSSVAAQKSGWTLSNTAADLNYNYVIIEDGSVTSTIDYTVDLTNPTGTPSWFDLTYHYNSTTNNHNILVVPQDLSTLAASNDDVMIRVTYDITNSADAADNITDVVKEINISTVIAGAYPDGWEAGKLYTYKLDINLYEILFSATVEDWVDMNAAGYIIY